MCPAYTTSLGAVNLDWERLSEGVYRCRLPFLDVTVGLVLGADRVLLVDCGTTIAEAGMIARDLGTLAGRTVTDVVLTHHHFDHILGSAGFPEARLIAAAPAAAALTARAAATGGQAVEFGADPVQVADAVAALRAPDRVVTDAVIDLGGRWAEVSHPGRGHTDHDLVVLVPGEPAVLFCGDLVEESADPAIGDDSDLPAWPGTLDRLLQIGGEGARYVPGHGAVVDAGFVRRQRDWLTSRC